MALSIFDDKSRPPKDAELATALKDSFLFWNELKKFIALRFNPLSIEWGFTSKKYAEGRGVRLEVRNSRDVRSVEKLATIKMAT